jgi:nucleotide-binding universal stress UspA family protein
MSQRILVAIDGGKASRTALDWAIAWSRFAPVELELCTVDVSAHSSSSREAAPMHERALRGGIERVMAASPSLQSATTIRNNVAIDQIVAGSAKLSCLVVGCDRSSGSVDDLRGTLPFTLAARADCPIIVVPVDWQTRYGPVVIGIDQATDDSALDFACRAATRLGTTLILVHAWNTPAVHSTSIGEGDLYEQMKKAGHRMLAAATTRLRRSHPGVKVLRQLVFGDASQVLTNVAAKAALAVLGTHHAAPLTGQALGATSDALLMSLPCPVALVPPLRTSEAMRLADAQVLGGGVASR